ncbi:MAG: AEC family transporter [Thermoanaerobaculaceae bacterium]|nr:AEC family transporter [Thermoanaerobaculaceae bacterium]MDI9622507.1 AEC family transporter [Acidobacteriota bacterium]NLH12023.1 AEC family transporter [Holophagae bacterium]HPW56167.1 AEC family transporter [Thermoanaerobaculaceae bacterium]
MLTGLVSTFLLLFLGFAARRWGLVDTAAATGLNRLVANLALPALFLSTIGTSRIEKNLSPVLVGVVIGATVLFAVVGWIAGRVGRLPGPRLGVMAQAAMRGNIVYLSFPLILASYGDPGLRLAALTASLLIPTMNVLSVLVLELARPQHRGMSRALLGTLVNPMVASAFVGLGLAAVAWHPWRWLAVTLGTLGDFALPGALLALGAQLQAQRLHDVWRPALAAAILKLVALPALGLWLLTTLGRPPLETAVGVLLLAAPDAVASYSVAADLGGDTDLAGACVLVTTVASLATYLVWKLLLPAV